MISIDRYLNSNGWTIVDIQSIPPRKAKFYDFKDIGLTDNSIEFLKRKLPKGLYLHQKMGIESYLKGENICLSTGTASGKSLVFYLAAIELLSRRPDAKIISIYPMKALGKEQESRWRAALNRINPQVRVGRIDGQVPVFDRINILKNSQILIMTPDIIHTWLMSTLSDKSVIKFLSKVSLIIVDEVHNYTGVFGSNSAYLFRRIQHIMSLVDSYPQYIAASATMVDPYSHLLNLFGLNFKVIGTEYDTSNREEIIIKLVEPPNFKDLLKHLSNFLVFIARNTSHKFIAFVDSRKQTEYISSIVSRSFQKERIEEEDVFLDYGHLRKLNILPYRAGYEESDRTLIQDRLSKGELTGVVSTSALELGIDIPFLSLGILVGVPHSSTSFYQRIGRIGRRSSGEVIVINRGDIYSKNIFRNPKQLLKMPFSESALYLENHRIQYIHALCLARHGGEHDQVCSIVKPESSSKFESPINWPPGFLEICKNERVGIIPPELQNIKAQAGDDPNHVFPLRDVDVQFQVKYKSGPIEKNLGSLSYSQLMREAYPGAVYYYTTKPFRVYRVRTYSRLVEVRREKHYTTKPLFLPTLVFPNFTQGNVHKSLKYGELIVVECNLQIRETLIGYKERRGPNEFTIHYPLDPTMGLYFDKSRFTRNYFTTGVVFTHPSFNNSKVKNDIIAKLIYEAFLIVIPFERRDINYATDKHRVKTKEVNEGERFICIYDQTYGSLRLSSRLMEDKILKKVLSKAIELSENDENLNINVESIEALQDMFNNLTNNTPTELLIDSEGILGKLDENHFVRVIMPGSKGLNVKKNNEEFFVEGVFFSPVFNKLAYRGRHLSELGSEFNDAIISVPFDYIKEIPGESKIGLYDLHTGELKEIK